MNKRQSASFIDSKLQELYPETPIPLSHKDPYTLLVAVLLSAQCTDERVNQITPALFELADNPQDMAKQSVDAVYSIIKPCGLAPQKSKAIVKLSTILVEQYHSIVPEDIAMLETLPGVGHKTASVVMSQAFGVPAFAVDTHIHRLAQRWRLTDGSSVMRTERDLKRLFPVERWNELHLQIIYYGREYCQARSCFGLQCPICSVVNEGRIRPIKARKA